MKFKSPFFTSYLFGTTILFCFLTGAFAKQPTPVIVTEVVSADFNDRVEALGTLRANETVEITATITDTITAIHFEDGQRVNKGDILIEMTSLEEHAQLEEELSTVAEAKKQYNRLKPLVDRGAAAKSLLDQRQREMDTAQARFRAIESRLQDRLIVAPFTGVVGLRDISVGALIEPGDLITTLDDDSVMKLDFNVPAVYLGVLRRGLSIEARASAFADRIFSGEISSINSRVDPITRAITVRALIANPELLLKPGLLMQVTLLKNPRTGLVVPEEALIPSGKKNHVLVVTVDEKTPKAQRKEVKIGVRQSGQVEVIEGLQLGDYVITHGTIRVRPGQQVVILSQEQGDEPLEKLLSSKKEKAEQ